MELGTDPYTHCVLCTDPNTLFIQQLKWIALAFKHAVFRDHANAFSYKNFLWVELHRNGPARNTLEPRSYAGTLHISFAKLCFRENPQNTQC